MSFLRFTTPLFSAVAMAMVGAECGQAQDRFETVEATTLIQSLRSKLAQSELAKDALAERVAAADIEAKQAGQEVRQLRTQVESLGLAALSTAQRGLEQRLLAATNDLRLERLRSQQLESSLFAARESSALSGLAPLQVDADPAIDIKTPKVVSVNRDLKLLVANLGHHSGSPLKIGQTLEILRQDRPIASAIVVEVRRSITGAIVTSSVTPSDFPLPGDLIKPAVGIN
jgi:outer membrane murein-binding lipoprotein Lpp